MNNRRRAEARLSIAIQLLFLLHLTLLPILPMLALILIYIYAKKKPILPTNYDPSRARLSRKTRGKFDLEKLKTAWVQAHLIIAIKYCALSVVFLIIPIVFMVLSPTSSADLMVALLYFLLAHSAFLLFATLNLARAMSVKPPVSLI